MNAKDKTKNHFNKTACEYNNSSDGKFVEGMYDILVDEILKSKGGKILDVGCGNGIYLKCCLMVDTSCMELTFRRI